MASGPGAGSLFTGERVRLRGLQESDLGDLARMEAQVQTLRLRRQGPVWPGGRAEAETFYERIKTDAPDRFSFAIEALDDGRFVGRCVLRGVSRTHRSAELGIGLLDDEAGHGLGRDALHVLLRYAFAGLTLHRVYVHVRADNERALATFGAAGFQEEARFREEAIDLRGNRVDVVGLSLLEDEWREDAA